METAQSQSLRQNFDTSEYTNPLLTSALTLAKLGFCVHPLEAGTKKPHLKGYQHLATTDEAQLRQWWDKWTNADPGIVCGPDSGCIILDVDTRHDGDTNLAELEAQHGELPLTWSVKTRDGWHYYFRHPKGCLIKSGILADGVEVIGAGHNAVGAGSIRHANEDHAEHVYEWLDWQRPSDLPLADIPQWLHALLRKHGLVQTVTSHQRDAHTSGINKVEVNTLKPHCPSKTENQPTGGILLLATSSTPLLEETQIPEKIDAATIKRLFSDWRIAQACMDVLRIRVQAPSKAFTCIVHGDKKTPSAAIMKAKDGEYRYSDLHHKVHEGNDSPPTYSLTSVYFAKRTGQPLTTRLNKASYLTWSLRLLTDAGVLPPRVLKAPKLKGETTHYERVVYDGFQQLLATKWLRTDKAPTPFTWSFAALWCGITERQVADGFGSLLRKGYIRGTGDYAHGAMLFTIGTRSLVNRRARRLKAQTQHHTPQPTKHADILTEVQADVDDMLEGNEAQCAYPGATDEDLYRCAIHGYEYDVDDFTFTCPHCEAERAALVPI